MAGFILDSAGMEAFLAMLPAPTAEAERVAERARQAAPYSDRTGKDVEHYRDSIETGEYFDGTSKRHTAYVRASVPWAMDVEVIHRTLGRAVGESGGSE